MEESLPRRLAAILYADVVGYSRMASEDEDATHRRLKESLDLISKTVTSHHGRVINYSGDAALAMFDAVVDAVSCAAAIQRDMVRLNQDVPDEQKIQFRIGVNMGDVIEDGGDIFGDGVNVAARLEGLAEPGGICISDTVHTAIGSKLPLDYDDLGEQEVKNITKLVRAYQVRLKSGAELPRPSERQKQVESSKTKRWQSIPAVIVVALIVAGGAAYWFNPWEPREEAASVENMAFPLPDKPSIAVLPFTNMSGDVEQEYFVDGMTEDLITDLSQISGLFVIARNSVFTYKDKAVKIRQVAEELGVRYVLEGSVRRDGDQVRINAQLIDATTGGHLWAERYDGVLQSVFAMQDEVTQKIVAALAVSLTSEEAVQQANHSTDSTEAHDAFLQGWAHYILGTRADLAKAKPFFEEAIRLDPDYARAHAALAAVYWDAYSNDWAMELGILSFDAEDGWIEHLELAMKVPSALAHTLQSRVLVSQSRYQEAVVEAEKAVALDGNKATAYAGLANALILAGKPAEGADLIRKSMRLDPHHPPGHLITLGQAQFEMEQFKEAAATFERAVKRNVDDDFPWIYLASSYGHLGRIKDADDAIESANDLRAKRGEGFLNLEFKSESHFLGQIDFSRSGGKQAQERLRAGLTGVPALRWQNLATHFGDGQDEHWFEVKGATAIDVHTAKSLYDRGVTFVDTRPERIRNEQGWIPRSVSLPEARSNTPNNRRLTEETLMTILDKTDEVVFYSAGLWDAEEPSAFASAKALNWGYQNVFYFDGGNQGWKNAGFLGWKKAGYPVEMGKK